MSRSTLSSSGTNEQPQSSSQGAGGVPDGSDIGVDNKARNKAGLLGRVCNLFREQKDQKDDGKAIVEWFGKLFDHIITIGSLGAGFSFVAVLSPLQEGVDERDFSRSTVNNLLAGSWLCFVLSVTCSIFLSSLFDFNKEWLETAVTARTRKSHSLLGAASFVVQALVLTGFLMASLAISAVSRVVGWTAVGFTGFFMLVLTLLFLVQAA